MVVETGHLEDFCLRQPHILSQRLEMRGSQMAVMILDGVKVFDQKVAPARGIAKQGADLVECLLVRARPLGLAAFFFTSARLPPSMLPIPSVTHGERRKSTSSIL